MNGRSVGSAHLRRNGPLVIGPASIGDRDSQASQATFKGRMDELVVVGRPLTTDEIRHMYTEGQPQAEGRLARAIAGRFAEHRSSVLARN